MSKAKSNKKNMDSKWKRPMTTNVSRMNRWTKWYNYNTWELKYKSLERPLNSNLTQHGRIHNRLLFSLAILLRNMLIPSPTLNMTSTLRKWCWWLRLRGKHVTTMTMGSICSLNTLSDHAINYKRTIKKYPKFRIKWMLPFPKHPKYIRQDKACQKKI
jgi:hypothetical protein